MPYNPGIQDISGQLLAQGMQARAQGIAGGVTTLFQGLQQNQMMTNQAIARFQAASAANPKLLDFLNKAGTDQSPIPVNPDVLKAYADIKSGKTNVQNTALLAQFADSYNQAQAAQQMQELRQAQVQQLEQEKALRAAQALETAAQTRTRQLQNLATEEDLRRSYGLTLPEAGGAKTQPSGQSISQIAEPTPAPQAAVPRSIYEMPGQPPMSKEEADYVVKQAKAQLPAGAEAAVKFAPQQPTTTPFKTPPGLDPQIYAAAKAEGLRSIAAGRGPIDVMAQYNKILTAQKAARVEQIAGDEQMTFDQAKVKAEEATAKDPLYSYSPKLNPNSTYGLEATLKPQEERRAQVETRAAEERALNEAALKENEADIVASREAAKRMAESDLMMAALDNPNMYVGFGAEAVQNAKRLLGSFGAGVKGVEDEARFNVLAGNRIFSQAKNLRPASDQDLQLLMKYNSSSTKSRDANKAILAFQRRGDQYEQEKAAFINDLREKKVPERQIRTLKAAWERSNPLNLLPEERGAILQTLDEAATTGGGRGVGGKPQRTTVGAAQEAASSVGDFFLRMTGKKPEDVLNKEEEEQ